MKAARPHHTQSEISAIVEALHKEISPLVHPQLIIQGLRREEASIERTNGWLADHIVGVSGTMGFSIPSVFSLGLGHYGRA